MKNKLENWKYWIAEHRLALWSVIGLLLALIALPFTIVLVQQRQTLQSNASWSGFFEGVHLCALKETTNTCPFLHEIRKDSYNTESTVQIFGHIYRDSGDEQLNEDISIVLDDKEIFVSRDHSGMSKSDVETFGPMEITIPPGEHTFLARHLDTSDNPSSPGSVGIKMELKTLNDTLQCSEIKLYDSEWKNVSLNDIFVGETYYVAVIGETTNPAGISKARFSFDDGTTWTETEDQNTNGEYYISWTAVDKNPVNIQAQVSNSNLGWK